MKMEPQFHYNYFKQLGFFEIDNVIFVVYENEPNKRNKLHYNSRNKKYSHLF